MKYLIILLSVYAFANAQTMSPQEHLQLHQYNQRPSLKKSAEQKAHRMHRINEKRAKAIARKKCQSGTIKLRLVHHDTYLYYIAKTQTCTVYINALDGTIIDPKKIEKGPQ